MLCSMLRHKLIKELRSASRSAVLSTLPKMDDNPECDSKVIQLCGTDNEAINKAVQLLKQGEVIAVPTDTVFGLACDASNSAAISKLYNIKGRDLNKPLAICLSGVNRVCYWAKSAFLPVGLLSALLPGPVTVILPRKEDLNPDLNPGVENVGIRIPGTIGYPFLDLVSAAVAYPLALTSANASNEPNCIHVEEFKSLWPKLGAVFDTSVNMAEHGWNTAREASTILDLTETGKYRIVRRGLGCDEAVKILKNLYLKEIK